MNNFDNESTQDLINKFCESNDRTLVNSIHPRNPFAAIEAEKQIKFRKCSINIPWYLKPFRKVIINIAYKSFVRGLDTNAPPIKIKRPTPFKVG